MALTKLKVPFHTADAELDYNPSGSNISIDTDDQFLKFRPPDLSVRTVVTTADTQTLTNKTFTSPTITNPTVTFTGGVAVKTSVTAVGGAALHAAVLNWQNPEGAAIIILRAWLDVTTVATGACTADVGYTAVSATTASDTLLDGVDVHTAIGVFDSMNAALDLGANALAQKAASGKWVTVKEASGDATGLVANLYVMYALLS